MILDLTHIIIIHLDEDQMRDNEQWIGQRVHDKVAVATALMDHFDHKVPEYHNLSKIKSIGALDANETEYELFCIVECRCERVKIGPVVVVSNSGL